MLLCNLFYSITYIIYSILFYNLYYSIIYIVLYSIIFYILFYTVSLPYFSLTSVFNYSVNPPTTPPAKPQPSPTCFLADFYAFYVILFAISNLPIFFPSLSRSGLCGGELCEAHLEMKATSRIVAIVCTLLLVFTSFSNSRRDLTMKVNALIYVFYIIYIYMHISVYLPFYSLIRAVNIFKD